jgi:hypothetical protein
MREGPPPRAYAMLGTSRWALVVAVVPLILTFTFLHYHYASLRAGRGLSHGSGGGSGAASAVRKVRAADLFAAPGTAGAPVVGASRLRSLLRSSDLFERPLRDGCDLAAPAAARASAHAHAHARALFSRNDFAGFLGKDLGAAGEGALVGVGGGAFMDALLGIWNSSKLHLVDAWKQQPGLGADANNVPDEQQETLLSETYSRLNSHDAQRYRVLRETSERAAPTFADCSLEFVYVDGRRDMAGVLADLIDWWPKVKPGGILAGHDYLDGQLPEGNFGVKTAADRFAQAVGRMVYATQVRRGRRDARALGEDALPLSHSPLRTLTLAFHCNSSHSLQGWPISDNSAEEWSSFYMFK